MRVPGIRVLKKNLLVFATMGYTDPDSLFEAIAIKIDPTQLLINFYHRRKKRESRLKKR